MLFLDLILGHSQGIFWATGFVVSYRWVEDPTRQFVVLYKLDYTVLSVLDYSFVSFIFDMFIHCPTKRKYTDIQSFKAFSVT